MHGYQLNYLEQLEAEAIYVIREAASQCERPVLLFSGGKDSICLAYLAAKAFYPGRLPFPMLHIDTGHNFPETLEFRDRFVQKLKAQLIVRRVEDSIAQGRIKDEDGPYASRNALQTVTLLDALAEFRFDAALGGARRDEEKARAKERFFSFRNRFGQWDPKNQRPEIWSLFNSFKRPGEHFRVFPLSNWTELDIWQYIDLEGIELPSLYFSHRRKVFWREGMLLPYHPVNNLQPGEEVLELEVRFRTIGDMTCTGAIQSQARTVKEIIEELLVCRVGERGSRADDRRSEAAMEDRKRQGYF